MNAQAVIYGTAAADYARAGWTCVLPIPAGQKFPPPEGFTGEHGADTSPEQIADWAGQRPDASIALRMPRGVIGLDVDHYVKGAVTKRGGDTLAAREAEWGPLPLTYCSTARGSDEEPGPSRIMFFRVPDQRYITKLPDIEIIQHHHRYALVAPSPHGDGGTYRWYGPDGQPLEPGQVPRPDQLAGLPPAWVQGLSEGAAAAGPVAAGKAAAQALLGELAGGERPACIDVERAMGDARRMLADAGQGSRHDTMVELTYRIVLLGAEGHHGVSHALLELMAAWDAMTSGEDREYEFTEMCEGAAAKAVTKIGSAQPAGYDPCLLGHLVIMPGAVPGDDRLHPDDEDGDGGPVGPARPWSPYEAIGTEPFILAAGLDSTIASEVLGRVMPVLRYAPDAAAWLVRGPDRWETRKGDMAKWAVELLPWLMPPGDPAAPKDSPDWQTARARARFATHASANAIAGKMHAQVAAGHHPGSRELTSLDADPDVLWAGGVPWDLRTASPARLDPGEPHLHTAALAPDSSVPTPLWDTFVTAVWPGEDVREWALRVLSIAFTGYSDKALPILLGATDRGKTELIKMLMSILGTYAHAADARLLSAADRSHASIVYALKGRRLSFIDEAPRTGHLAQERLKQLTGGAELTGNRMGENPITFRPTHTLILTANPDHEPQLADPAVRRRVRLIPCEGDPAQIRAARAAIGFLEHAAWRAEAPGVLAQMMERATAWLAEPLSASNEQSPVSIRTAVDEITIAQDLIYGWLEGECVADDGGTRARDLYKHFTASCRNLGVQPGSVPSETRWGKRLSELGFPPDHRRDGNYRRLRIREPDIYAGRGASSPPALRLVPHAEAAGGEGLGPNVNGSWRVSGEPSTPQNPSSTPITKLPVKGVNSTDDSIRTHTRTHARTQGVGKTAEPSPPSTPEAQPAETPVRGSPEPFTAPSTTLPTWENVPEPETLHEPESPPETGPPTDTKTRRKAVKAVLPRPDPALEGPVHQLPVIVARNPEGGLPLVLPCTLDEARQAVEPALGALSVDCETTGYPPGHADFALRTVQLGDEYMAADFDPADEDQRKVIADLVSRARKLHAHSAAADLVPLVAAGLASADELWAKMEDSVLIIKLGDPGLAGSDENELKKLAAVLLGEYAVSPPAEKAKNALFASGKWLVKTTPLTPVTRSGWAQVKPGCETMARYAGSDVLDMAAVLRVLPRPDEVILAREREFQAMCARVSHAGFRLDSDHITAKIAEYETARETALQRVTELCPAITNPSSTTEVPAALDDLDVPLERTKPSKKFPQGQLSAAKEVLEPLAADPSYEHHELLRSILDYRHDVTTLGLLLRPLQVLCEHGDGRMRPVVYTINADTGRTSCVRPNGQQFSRQGGIRACVIADEGMAGISADFSGVEIRVGAALSGDQDLLRAETSAYCLACTSEPCTCGQEQSGLHWMAARMAFGPDATKEDRYNSKRIIFSKMFGGGPKSGARQVGIPEDAAVKVHRAFERIAPRFAQWDQQMRAYADAGHRGYRAYSGRTIWLPRHRSHAAGNYAIQGTARELLVDGALRWHQTRWGRYPLLPIHDELLTFVPAAEAAEALETLKACMRNQHFYEWSGVPIEAAADEPFLAWPDSS